MPSSACKQSIKRGKFNHAKLFWNLFFFGCFFFAITCLKLSSCVFNGDSPPLYMCSLPATEVNNIACDMVLCFGRHDCGSQLLTTPGSTSVPSVSLLETVGCLINPKFPWSCKVVGYLQQRKIYCLFRGIIVSVPVSSVSVLWSSICSLTSVWIFLVHLTLIIGAYLIVHASSSFSLLVCNC